MTRKNACLVLIGLILATVCVGVFYLSYATHHSSFKTIALKTPPLKQDPKKLKFLSWKSVTVKKGDSLAKIFKRLRIPYQELNTLLKNKEARDYLTRLQPNEKIAFQLNSKHFIFAVKYPIDEVKTLYLSREKNGFKSRIEKKSETSVLLYKSGVIHSTLAAATKKAGFTATMLDNFISIFHGSINFSRSLHRGDRFSVLYKEYYVNGKKDHPGEIVVAELQNHDKIYRAIRFSYPRNHVGYYTPNGHGLKPFILLPPLRYNHISSYFTYHRFDPIAHRIQPHLGIDYAAPLGTPIRSVGDGKVIFAGRDDGYGNAVIIKYGRKFKALYGHMEHFIRHLHAGEYVHQGEIIGYVGDTGWSTGPHLHFALYVWGTPKDPLKLKFTSHASVPKDYLSRFRLHAKELLAQLQLYEGPDLAINQKKPHINEE